MQRCRSFTLTLLPGGICGPRPEWGYHLYAWLLAGIPDALANRLHQEGLTPISQHTQYKNERLYWHIRVFREELTDAVQRRLENASEIRLTHEQLSLKILSMTSQPIPDIDELFEKTAMDSPIHTLRFVTPTAFKSRGRYIAMPSESLILNNLIRQWNGCFPQCPIEDEDHAGAQAIASGLYLTEFQIRSQGYHVKGNRIPGFVGKICMESRLQGFHDQLARALFAFSEYSGIGIKTALGMGGVVHTAQKMTREVHNDYL